MLLIVLNVLKPLFEVIPILVGAALLDFDETGELLIVVLKASLSYLIIPFVLVLITWIAYRKYLNGQPNNKKWVAVSVWLAFIVHASAVISSSVMINAWLILIVGLIIIWRLGQFSTGWKRWALIIITLVLLLVVFVVPGKWFIQRDLQNLFILYAI